MATINGFHPLIPSSLSSQRNKSQTHHTTLHCIHSTSHKHPMSAFQRSSFIKISCDHHRLLTIVTRASDNSQPEAQLPAKSPLSTWKNWIIGLMLSILVPSLRHNWGPLLALKSKVDIAIDTVEAVTEVVEELAEEVEKVAEQVAEKLPEDAKLKNSMESIENLAEEAVKKAELAKDVIHKVEDAEKEVEKALTTGSDIDPVKGDDKKNL